MSRKVLLSATSAVLLPVLIALVTAQATGATPKKQPPAVPAKSSAEEPGNPFSAGPAAPGQPARKAPPPTPAKAAVSSIVGGERAILKALKEPTSLQFVETPLQDVIDYLREKHHIEIQLDKKELESLSIGPDTLVTKNLRGISLRSALKLMLDELQLKYVVHNEVLLITSPTRTESEEFQITKVYDVADLVLPGPPDYPYRGDRLPGSPAEAANQARVADFDCLISLITSSVAPKSWAANGGPADIATHDLCLVISQSFETHEEIAALLAKLRAIRRRATPTVVVDFQWLWLAAGPYQELVGDGASAAGRVPSAVDVKVLDQVARKAAGFRGRIMCANGQLVHLASGDRRLVIAGATPTVEVKAARPPDGAMGPYSPVGPGGMGVGGGMFSVASSMGHIGPLSPISPMASSAASAPAPPSAPAVIPATSPQAAPAPGPVIVGQTAYQPVIDVPNVGVVVEVRPSIAPGADTAVLDVQCFVTRWGKPSPPAKLGGAGSASCPVDRINMPAADLVATARVPLGKPVLLGAVTFAPAGGAGLDKATDTPVQLCLIATTRIAACAKKPAKK